MLIQLYLSLFFFFVNCDLTPQRLANAEAWDLRALDDAHMTVAYANNITVNYTEIYHVVQDTGDFGPGSIAEEYDRITIDLTEIIGYAPVILGPTYDPNAVRWLDNNTLITFHTDSIMTGFNTTTRQYQFIGYGFRDIEVIRYDPNSPLINLGYSIQDPAAEALYAASQATYSIELICGIIFQACDVTNSSGYNYLQDTDFTTIIDCITFLSTLNPKNPCPYPQRSNTTICRTLHGFSALLNPAVHCAHVRPVSMVCVDTCLPACSNCDPNAKCVATYPNFPTIITPVYQCQCNNGYIGNGATCTALMCNYGNCPAPYGYYNCSTGLCMCADTFTAQPALMGVNNSLCVCPTTISGPGQIVWENGLPICVPAGRCLTKTWQCINQAEEDVKCLPQNNTFTQFGGCVCNPGFTGGWEFPCNCAPGNTVSWSNVINGNVCLAPGQCIANYQCPRGKTCVISPGQPIGICS
jgi:hypothetical protein